MIIGEKRVVNVIVCEGIFVLNNTWRTQGL